MDEGGRDPLVVYLVVRQSDDCAPNMVEIMGACTTLADADSLREYIFGKFGRRCHVQWLHPEEPLPAEATRDGVEREPVGGEV